MRVTVAPESKLIFGLNSSTVWGTETVPRKVRKRALISGPVANRRNLHEVFSELTWNSTAHAFRQNFMPTENRDDFWNPGGRAAPSQWGPSHLAEGLRMRCFHTQSG